MLMNFDQSTFDTAHILHVAPAECVRHPYCFQISARENRSKTVVKNAKWTEGNERPCGAESKVRPYGQRTVTAPMQSPPEQRIPDALTGAPFPATLATTALYRSNLRVVCDLPLQGDHGGPTSISHTTPHREHTSHFFDP